MLLDRKIKTNLSTIGDFSDDGQFICRTLELPWKDNQHDISCIPNGTYVCKRVPIPSHLKWMENWGYKTIWEITNVPGRVGIFIHIANKPEEIKGCVAVGMSISTDYVGHSKLGMDLFMEHTKDLNEFQLGVVGG